MLDNYDAQSSLLAYLKANSAIDTVLTNNGVSDVEVREKFWRGEDFSYPNVRIACSVTPAQADCGPDSVSVSIVVSSEEKSSKQSAVIAGVIAKQLHNHNFTKNNVRYSQVVVGNLPYPVQENGIWQSEIQATANAALTT